MVKTIKWHLTDEVVGHLTLGDEMTKDVNMQVWYNANSNRLEKPLTETIKGMTVYPVLDKVLKTKDDADIAEDNTRRNDGSRLQVWNAITKEDCFINYTVSEDRVAIKVIKGENVEWGTEASSTTWQDGGRRKQKKKTGGSVRKGSLESNTVVELKEKCTKKGIKHSGLKKSQLIAALRKK